MIVEESAVVSLVLSGQVRIYRVCDHLILIRIREEFVARGTSQACGHAPPGARIEF